MDEGKLPEYLRSDTPPCLACDRCGRKSWADTGLAPCGMSQPDGATCDGILVPVPPPSEEESDG